MPEHFSGHHIEKESHSETVDQYVRELLAKPTDSGEFEGKTETEQGIAIIDRFVGALARRDGIVDSGGNIHDTETVLREMSKLQSMDDLKHFTRTEGLRAAVKLLAEDPRTANLFSGAYGGALQKDTEGRMLLRNQDQLEGYLNGGANNAIKNPVGGVDMAGSGWMAVIKERMQMVLERNGQWIFNPYKGIIESDNPYLREEGNKWRRAVSSAEKVGVDAALIGRSVEAMKAKKQGEQRALGANALRHMDE